MKGEPMEKQQAIELLEDLAWDKDNEGNCYGEALQMAIEALKAQLSQEDTTFDNISRQAAIDAAKRVLGDHEISRTMQTALHILPSAQPEIVRCKDCKYNVSSHKCLHPESFFLVPDDDFYCGYAERRTDAID